MSMTEELKRAREVFREVLELQGDKSIPVNLSNAYEAAVRAEREAVIAGVWSEICEIGWEGEPLAVKERVMKILSKRLESV